METDYKAKLQEIEDYMEARFRQSEEEWEEDNTSAELIADFFAETLDGIEDILRAPLSNEGNSTMDEPVALTEKSRVYDFGTHTVVLEDVVELVVRPSGTHRVKTADGKLHVIAAGWLAIHIDDSGKDWTV